jgi:hypothetical protein
MPVGGVTSDLSPANIDLGPGAGMEPSTNVQFAAGMSGGRRRRRMSRRGRSRRGGAAMPISGGRRRRRMTRRVRRSRRSRR